MTTSSFPLVPAPFQRHIIHLLRERARRAPGRILVSGGGRELSAEALLETSGRLAATLAEAGLRKGDRVAIQLGNRLEFLEAFTACAQLGLFLVPVNTASKGHQLAYYLQNSASRALITESGQMPHLMSALECDAGTINGLARIWFVDAPPASSAQLKNAQLLEKKSAPLSEGDPGEASEPALVMYTSGTSGPSKGVMCSHAQLYWWGHYSIANIGIREDDVLYTCLPLFHVNALNTFYQALVSGGRMVIGERFSVSRFYRHLIESDATVTYLLGAMVPMLLSRPADASERQHRVRVALAPGVPEKYFQEFEPRTGIRMIDGFGSTESNFVIGSSLEDRKPGWMGKVIDGFEARVVDEQDNEVPHGTPGELVLRAREPFAFALGYFGMPDKTIEAWRNLWLHTGDRVVRDEAGYFKFLDRLKDSIRRRGENISSYEVEQVVGLMPGVEHVAVYAVPSELAEDEVMCAIVPRAGHGIAGLDVVRWCESRMPHFAVPRFVRFVDDLPKTENGKVQKYKLRQEGVTADTWDLAASGHAVKR
ncbi:ATP-dependent acyl-CoA ligase [Pigmentiphaga sp. CHJ604]|uniref:ATP-dependent acyl-CoA ligase n=1 Tax=Pigmentiphaga sp. CHJ604 TaxID=3081984 RepID=UPI0030D59F3E